MQTISLRCPLCKRETGKMTVNAGAVFVDEEWIGDGLSTMERVAPAPALIEFQNVLCYPCWEWEYSEDDDLWGQNAKDNDLLPVPAGTTWDDQPFDPEREFPSVKGQFGKEA